MSESEIPKDGNQFGKCDICGNVAYPMYGKFLCTAHASKKWADIADNK